MCNVSCVRCHMSHGMCHLSHVKIFLFTIFFKPKFWLNKRSGYEISNKKEALLFWGSHCFQNEQQLWIGVGNQHEGNQFILAILRKTVQNAVRKFKLYSCTWRISGNYSLTFHSLETPSYSCTVAAGAWIGQGAEARPGAGSNEGAGASAGEGAGNKDDKEGPLAPSPTEAQG